VTRQFALVLGGARSGKSGFAQRLAGRLGGSVIFIATARPEDEEMRRRIEEHRRARPRGWHTVEAPVGAANAVGLAARGADVVLLDCVSLLVSNLMAEAGSDLGRAEDEIAREVENRREAYLQGKASLIAVSNEVGAGVVPPYPLGRRYRDLLGRANQRLAQIADRVYWMVAGLPVEIKASGLGQQWEGGDGDA
jgi:adenosylcobinamide kinase/adenosylcobinamide-phosphate guanylyltransferase